MIQHRISITPDKARELCVTGQTNIERNGHRFILLLAPDAAEAILEVGREVTRAMKEALRNAAGTRQQG